MPTPLDRALNSRNALLTFAGVVSAVAAWNIWSGEMFPAEKDPTGDPEHWTEEDMRSWLNKRNLVPDPKASRDELLERIRLNMRLKR